MNILYWLELIVVIFIARKYKFTASILLKIAWWGTVAGAILFSETTLRIFFVFWIIGVIKALIELRNEEQH